MADPNHSGAQVPARGSQLTEPSWCGAKAMLGFRSYTICATRAAELNGICFFRTKHTMHPEWIAECGDTHMGAWCAVFQRRFGCDELLFVRLTARVTGWWVG